MASNDSKAGMTRRELVAGALSALPVHLAAQTQSASSPGPVLDIAEWSYYWYGVEHATLARGTVCNGMQMYVEHWVPAQVKHPYPVVLIHGETQIYGYRFGSAAYLTDHSEIPESSLHQLHGLDILFLDALRHKPHPTHSTVKNSLAIVERLKPKRAFFTHICHDLPHEATNATLPRHVRLSHDGMKLEFEI